MMDYILDTISRHVSSKLILLIFFSLYLIFPSGSSTTDGWNYAAEIRHAGVIFHPHHLLYNLLGFIFCRLPSKAGIDVLACLKALNAVFATLTIFVVQLIYKRLGKNELSIFLISCLTGFSFAIMRFGTENETYIVPLFLALTSSYHYLKFTFSFTKRYAVSSAIWVTLSVLFHQVFIFWWMGIFLGILISKKLNAILWYGFVSLTGPLVYLIVIVNISGNLNWASIIDFISGDFRNNAHLGITINGLFFSVVNLIRSFIQIHGYILNLARSNFLMILPCISSLIFFFLAILHIPARDTKGFVSQFTLVHIIIIILQFLFAVLAAGNAKFMVMIPVLVFILAGIVLRNYEKFFLNLMAGMAIWNLAYGIVPLHYYLPEEEIFLSSKAFNDRQLIVIASDDQLIKSMIYYQTGLMDCPNIFKSPAILTIKGLDTRLIEHIIDSTLNKGSGIMTDCIGSRTISRASISEGKINEYFFRRYIVSEIKSWKSIMGRKNVFKIEAKI